MKQNTQPIAEPDSEQFFPGEEPFSRKKRERQRLVALYLTLIVSAALLGIGVILRYTLLASAYKAAPYQPPTLVSNTSEDQEKLEESSKPDQESSASTGNSSSGIPSDLRASYFSDAPDSGNSVSASSTPAPSPTPPPLVPDAVPAPRSGVEERVTIGEVVKPIEVTPLSGDVTPSIRLFELPSPPPPVEPSKLTAMSKGTSTKIGRPKAPQESGGLKLNITSPTITTLPGSLPQPGTNEQQPSSPLPAGQSGVPAPSSGSTSPPGSPSTP